MIKRLIAYIHYYKFVYNSLAVYVSGTIVNEYLYISVVNVNDYGNNTYLRHNVEMETGTCPDRVNTR